MGTRGITSESQRAQPKFLNQPPLSPLFSSTLEFTLVRPELSWGSFYPTRFQPRSALKSKGHPALLVARPANFITTSRRRRPGHLPSLPPRIGKRTRRFPIKTPDQRNCIVELFSASPIFFLSSCACATRREQRIIGSREIFAGWGG